MFANAFVYTLVNERSLFAVNFPSEYGSRNCREKNMQPLTKTDLAFKEFECEKGCDGKRFVFFIIIHTFFSSPEPKAPGELIV